MSAFGGKADMTVCGCLLSRSLLGVKRTSHFAAHMSAFDPKRTWVLGPTGWWPYAGQYFKHGRRSQQSRSDAELLQQDRRPLIGASFL